MLNKRADKLELLRIAEAVALEKSIDKELIINSMETGIAKAAKSKFGQDNEIKVLINRDNGDIGIFRKLVIVEKPENINTEISLQDAITISDENKVKNFQENGYGELPICIAKTQFSFSTDPSLKGAPSGHVLPIREVSLSSGAEFIVVVCGAIMTMPGLPRVPAANSIKINDKGDTEGLF